MALVKISPATSCRRRYVYPRGLHCNHQSFFVLLKMGDTVVVENRRELNGEEEVQNGHENNGEEAAGLTRSAKRPRLHEANKVRNRVTVVLGAQWGDEGKGKVVDLLAGKMDIVARCQVRRNVCIPVKE